MTLRPNFNSAMFKCDCGADVEEELLQTHMKQCALMIFKYSSIVNSFIQLRDHDPTNLLALLQMVKQDCELCLESPLY